MTGNGEPAGSASFLTARSEKRSTPPSRPPALPTPRGEPPTTASPRSAPGKDDTRGRLCMEEAKQTPAFEAPWHRTTSMLRPQPLSV